MDYDVGVIGSGPGGYVAAIRAAQLGAKVALVEDRDLGGVCLNRGCIPTKALLHSAGLAVEIAAAKPFGVAAEPTLDFAQAYRQKDTIVERLRNGVALLMKKNRIALVRGRGKLLATDRIGVTKPDGSTAEIACCSIILATGSAPIRPSSLMVSERIVTSDEILWISELPRRLLIVGGGYIGCEFACIFRAFGSEVTIVEMLPRLLPAMDEDLAKETARAFKRRRIKLMLETKVEQFTDDGQTLTARLSNGQVLEADLALLSLGRTPCAEGIGLADAGVVVADGAVPVDEGGRTNVENIFAIGDLTGGPFLAHWATAQGMVAAENAMGQSSTVTKRVVPACIFTQPEIAVVGLTEQDIPEGETGIRVGRSPFAALGRAQALGETRGFAKLLARESTGEIVGGAVIGARASDLIAEVALAIQLRATVEQFARTIRAHPTLAEIWTSVAEDWLGRCIHK